MKKNIVVLTGAGISKESGLGTFRDEDGMWNKYDFMRLATPQAWNNNKKEVLDFYNERRKQSWNSTPNTAHRLITELEENNNVYVITQNVDNLHERAGTKNILHLHGELVKARSEKYDNLIYDISKKDINIGDKCERGFQLRPHIVWFGEPVPMFDIAVDITKESDIFIVIGTSLEVYPAASLIDYVPHSSKIYIIDPFKPKIIRKNNNLQFIEKNATEGMQIVYNILIDGKLI